MDKESLKSAPVSICEIRLRQAGTTPSLQLNSDKSQTSELQEDETACAPFCKLHWSPPSIHPPIFLPPVDVFCCYVKCD